MAATDSFRVGLIGYGIGKLYSAALLNMSMYYPDLPPVKLVEVATASEASGEQAMKQFGFQRYTTDYRALLARDDINMVIIATPNSMHRDMLLAALRSDKAIYIDKPLTNNLAEAREVVEEARRLQRDAHLSFVMRYTPALVHARKLLQEKRLGEIYAFRFSYFRSSYTDPERPLRWKASMATSGGGVVNDLVPHLADLLLWLLDRPERLIAQTRTFISERPIVKGKPERTHVDTDDHVIIQFSLPGGAIGTIESGRLITGATNDIKVEIYGSKGSLRWEQANPDVLSLAERNIPADEQGWLQIATAQHYPNATFPGLDIPLGLLRIYVASLADFLDKTRAGQQYDPGLTEGLRVQAIVEAALQAARSNTWTTIAQQ